jgi:hypothetical protein
MVRIAAGVFLVLGLVAGLAWFLSSQGTRTTGFSPMETVKTFQAAGVDLGVETTLPDSAQRFEPTNAPFDAPSPDPRSAFAVLVFPSVASAREYVAGLSSEAGLLRRENVVVDGGQRERRFTLFLRGVLAKIGVIPSQLV